MPFELPQLKYSYDALEPYLDAQTMEIHHTKHHRAYTNKLNDALSKHPDLAKKSAEDIIANIESVPEEIKIPVKNNGGGYINHNLFWQILTPPKGGNKPTETPLAQEIQNAFISQEQFEKKFTEAAATHFGSGWIWLIADKNSQLQITATTNQDSPLSEGNTPILALDVWEHAYYLKYQNRRPEFIKAWWNVVNWEKVNDLYQTTLNQ